MALEGNIENFTLIDVLTLISNSKKSGILYIEGKRMEEDITGEIYLSNGKIVDAKSGTSKGEDAFFQIVLLDKGKFSFKPQEINIPLTITKNLESLLMEAMRMKEETEEIYKKIPSLDLNLEINPTPPTNEIVLTNEEWQILNLFTSSTKIKDAIKKIDMPELKILKIIYSLISIGLLKKEEIISREITFDSINKIYAYMDKLLGIKASYFPLTSYINVGSYNQNVLIDKLNKLKEALLLITDEKKTDDIINYIKKFIESEIINIRRFIWELKVISKVFHLLML